MKVPVRFVVGSLLVAGLVGSARLSTSVRGAANTPDGNSRNRPRFLRARAIVTGAPGSSIMGEVIFTQRPCAGCPTPGLTAPATDPGFRNFPEATVNIVARIYGSPTELTPGAHGMHIHQFGVCDAPTFATAGGHFDPGPFASSLPVDANHPFHMGDVPNLIVSSTGVGTLRHRSSRITLSDGPLSVFDADGSAVVVHLNPDRGINGSTGASGGPRLACGIIQMLSDADARAYDHPDYDDDNDDR